MHTHKELSVDVIVNGPIQGNCYLVAEATSRAAVIIDPGDEDELILARVRQLDLQVQAILCTHAHIDHAGAVAPLQRVLGVPFALHDQEQTYLAHMPHQAILFGLSPVEVPTIDRSLQDGDTIPLGSLTAEVRFTPGHSAGGCCFYFAAQQVVFVGDTLFAGSVGRTDLPGGSTQTLITAIRHKLLSLPDEVVVYCGHGPATDIGTQRRTNPFLR